jgi:short-subunit dehydrogenase
MKVGSWEAYQKQERCIQVNVMGLMATVNAAMEHFKEVKEGGQVVGIGSVAAFRGAAQLSAYGASKAFVETYMEGVRNEVLSAKKEEGLKDVVVTTIQ